MFKKGSVKGTLPGCVKLTPVQVAAPVREVVGNKVGTGFLSFSVLYHACAML